MYAVQDVLWLVSLHSYMFYLELKHPQTLILFALYFTFSMKQLSFVSKSKKKNVEEWWWAQSRCEILNKNNGKQHFFNTK